MGQNEKFRRYIVLPDFGLYGSGLSSGVLAQDSGNIKVERRPGDLHPVRIIDSIAQHGPRLVEMTQSGELALRREYGAKIQIFPLQRYQIPRISSKMKSDQQSELSIDENNLRCIKLINSVTGMPIPGARVLAFTLFRHREGAQGYTEIDGVCRLIVPTDRRIERLYVFPPAGFWGLYRTGIPAKADMSFVLDPIDLNDKRHSIRRLYGDLPEKAGENVRIGIVDTGIDASHHSLEVSGGCNLVLDEVSEDPSRSEDYYDVDQHGTHVAGIIGARKGLRGVAPGAELIAYRVFPKNGDGASNYDIAKAVLRAVADGCDIVNLSLGGSYQDLVLRKAIEQAAKEGILVVCAAGNDQRGPLSYPANYEQAIAVTAIGLSDGFPIGSLEEGERSRPVSSNMQGVFLSSFTNVGPLVDLTAPGVGICSTVPGNRFAVMSGTSMAAPVVSGFAAHLLSSHKNLMRRERDAERRNDLVQLLYRSTKALGLGRFNEGFGMPLPSHIPY